MPEQTFEGIVALIKQEASGRLCFALSKRPIMNPQPTEDYARNFVATQEGHSGILGLLMAAQLNDLQVIAHVDSGPVDSGTGYRKVNAVTLSRIPEVIILNLPTTEPAKVETPPGSPKPPPENPPIDELPGDRKPGPGQQQRSMAENEMLSQRSMQTMVERLRLENDKKRLELGSETLRLAAILIKGTAPALSDEE